MNNVKSRSPALVVPPLTPFDDELRVNRDALAAHIDYVVKECGATMIVAAGVETQEYRYLPFEARKALVRDTIDAVAGRVPVVVSVSHPSYPAPSNSGNWPLRSAHTPFNCSRRCVPSAAHRARRNWCAILN